MTPPPAATRVARGSTADYCADSVEDTHHMVTHLRGGALVHVRICFLCGWIDFDDLDEQVRAHLATQQPEPTP